jgi:hypothetical protein
MVSALQLPASGQQKCFAKPLHCLLPAEASKRRVVRVKQSPHPFQISLGEARGGVPCQGRSSHALPVTTAIWSLPGWIHY